MLVRPGTYNEQLTVPWIPGASFSQVIFTAENGDSSSVILQFDPTNTNKHVVKLENASGITWEKMTFNALGTDYGRVFQFSTHSFDNRIQHCAINGINTSGTTNAHSCIYSDGTNTDNLFQYNTIKHGSYGIQHEYFSSFVNGFEVRRNRIENFSAAGLQFAHTSGLQIDGNTIVSTKNATKGIDIYNENDTLAVSNNKLELSSGQYGILLDNIEPVSARAHITNNMVYVQHASSAAYGIRAYTLSNTDVIHNTLKVTGPNSANVTLQIDVATQDSIFNNLITAFGGGIDFYMGEATLSMMDNNGYYHTGPILGKYNYGAITLDDLAEWQSLTGFDADAVFYPPFYLSETNLHLGNSYLNGQASPAWASTYDIDGDLRNSTNPDPGADEFDPQPLDASIAALLSPAVSCDTFQNIKVVLINLGNDTLTDANIHWTLNGDIQTPATFSGQLLPEGDTAHILVQATVPFNDQADTLSFWAEDLNGDDDLFMLNDTLTRTYSLSLSGSYTIGGVTPDFATIADAVSALQTFAVCGPVTFLLRNGTYTEQFSIDSIPGSSTLNTITFSSENQDSSLVTIQFNATSTANYIVQLDGAKHLRFEHLGFKIINTTYANIFFLRDGAGDVRIEHCYLEGRSPTISSGNSYLCYTNDAFEGDVELRNNYFLNGTRAIYLLGNVTPAERQDSFIIEDNRFVNQRTGAILAQQLKDISIERNSVVSNTTATYTGIQLTASHGTNAVAGNKVNLTATGDGITINGVNSESSLPGLCKVYNNLSSVVSGSACTLSTNRRVQFVYNTGYTAGTTASSHHAIKLFGGDSITVQNNIGVANAGRAYSETFYIPIVNGDYNNYYTSGTELAYRANTPYADLASWQAGTTLDSNSFSINPLFVSSADLHILNSALNAVALPQMGITADFDDQLRNPTTPDIGADEIGTEPGDVGILAALPDMPFAHGLRDVKAVIRNYGSDTLMTAVISWTLNGDPQPDYYYTGELPSLGQDTVVLGELDFELSTAYQLTIWTSLPNEIADSNPANDTLNQSAIYPAVSGTIVIGPTGELLTIANAVNAMTQGGILDSVRFEIQTGTYHESISLNSLSFLDCNSQVVFTSVSGNAEDVVWDNLGTGTHTILFNGADGIEFSHLTINTVINAFNAIKFQNASTCNTISHCILNGVTTTNNTSGYSVIHGVSTGSTNYNHNITIEYNTFSNGSFGVYWDGATGTTGLHVAHNILQDAYAMGMLFYRLKAPQITANTISSNSAISIFYGIYAEACAENASISANQVLLHGKRSLGIYYYLSSGTALLPGRISNNYIIGGQGAGTYGLQLNNCNYVHVYHNTIRISGGDNTGTNILRHSGGNIQFLNNILDNQANGKTMQFNGSGTPLTTDYNTHYTDGTNLINYLGTNYTSLAAWQATGRDVNSQFIEPLYDEEDPLGYAIDNAEMNGSAIPGTNTPIDIEGMPRDLTMPDIGCDEFDLFTHDVGLVSISYPKEPFPSGTNTVYIKFINNGEDTLTSMMVDWEVDSILQPGYLWTGLLPSAGTYDSLDIGEFDFTSREYHSIKVWLSEPNEMQDELATNDTIYVDSLYPGLHGTYTIGGVDPDFESITEAVDELNKGGAYAPVTFNIRSGTYLDTILLHDFPGSDCDRPVIFQSESGNREDVLITNLGYDAHTIVLNGADGVIFQNLQIASVNPAFRHVVSYYNSAHCNQFTNNTLIGFEGNTSASSAAVIYSESGLDTQNVFSANLIQNGSYGLYLYGATTGIAGTVIEGNTFDQQFSTGVYAVYEKNITVDHNVFHAADNDLIGVVLYLCHNFESVSNNKFDLPDGGYGLYIEDCDNLVSSPGLIANNFISIGGTSIARGIYMTGSSYHHILNNNFHITNTHSGLSVGTPLYLISSPSLQVYNNNCSNAGAGYGIYANNNTTFLADHNNYYVLGEHVGYWNGTSRTTLSDWQTATGQDVNAVQLNPQYMSDADLHVSNILLNGAGLFQALVPQDIDGESRQNPPDIGADEFDPSIANDAGVFMVVGPHAPFAPGSQPIDIAIKNFGADTLTSVNVRWVVNGIEQSLYAWTGSLPSAQCDTVTIGTFNFPEYTAHDLICWTESPNNIPDSTSVNDTIHLANVYAALSGPYTVGGVLPDFNLFSQLENALHYGGILNDVTFSIRNGTYASQLLIQNFPRLSSAHSVTFTAESGDSSLVSLTRNFVITGDNNYTVRLKDAHGIRFENISLASTKGRVLEMINGTSDVAVANCHIKGVQLQYAYNGYELIYSGTTSEDSITISNNYFEYGEQGIYMLGSSGDREKHHVIEYNQFHNCFSRSIYSRYTQDLQLNHNTITNSLNLHQGIVVSFLTGNISISSNDIRLLAGGGYGISIYASDGTAMLPIQLNNNYILSRNSIHTTYGIAQEDCDHVKYNYNTVRLEDVGSGSIGFNDIGSYYNIHLRNCIFSNESGGKAINASWSPYYTNNTYNHCNFYTTGSVLAYLFTNYADLQALQTGTSQNLQGVSVESLFDGDGPDVLQAALDGEGIPVSGVTTDIYGAARNGSTPDIGAREFTLLAHDIGAKLLQAPKTYCGFGATEEVTIRIQNYGANPETGFNVSFKFGNNTWVTENIGGLVVQPGGILDYTFTPTVDLSQVDIYTFSLATSLSGDLNSTNDTITNLEVIHIPALVEGVDNMLPVHNAIDVDKTVNLSWSPAPNATKYDVYIWEVGDPEPISPQISDLAQINKNYSSVAYGQTYEWKVVAKNSCNQMVGSVTQVFTVRNLPDLVVDTVIAPPTAFTGQSIEVEWVVRNQGAGSSQGVLWSDAVYLSSDATLNPSLDFYLGSVQNLTALDSGMSYTNEATFTLPNYSVGNYYVFVYSDRFSNLTETDNNNNWERSAAVSMIELSPLPDMDMVVVTAPELALSGQSISVLYTVENSGTAATGLRTWHDRVMLSSDPFNPVGYILGTFPQTGNLEPDSSYTKTIQAYIPNSLDGIYYIFIQSDFHNVIYEFAAESNNVMRSDTMEVVLTPPADLVITDIQIADTISSGYPNVFSWTVSNMGAGPSLSGKWKDQLYISPAPIYNPNFNLPFSSQYRIQNVLSQDEYTLPAATLSLLLPAGYYYLYGNTDIYNDEFEFNMEANNQYAHPDLVYLANPDLHISQPVFPDTVDGTSAFTLSWLQINDGGGRYINKNVKTKVYGSNLPSFDPENATLLRDEIKWDQGMAGIDTLEKSATISFPPYLQENVYLHFRINDNGAVFEATGDSNNIYSAPLPVYVIGPPVPDMEVVSFSVPDTVTAGITWTLQYASLNRGNLQTTLPWDDDVFISFDSVWTPLHNTKLVDINQSVMVSPSDTAHTSVLITLHPETNENVYYIYVKTDEKDIMFEGPGENNNIKRSGSFYVKGAPFVDVAIDTVELETTALMSGLPYDISWRTSIRNGGTPVITNWKDHAFLSSDQVLDTLEDIRVGLYSPTTNPYTFGPLIPYDQSGEIRIPVGVSGNYYLIVESDFTVLHFDSIRQNNIELLRDSQGAPLLLNIQLSPSPDLFVSVLSAPSSVVVGQPFEILFCTENIGNQVAAGIWQNQIYLSADLQINSGDIPLSTFNSSLLNGLFELPPDSTFCYPLQVFIPAQYAGNFYIIARTDPTNKVYEHNGENNNVTIREIEATLPLPADLIINQVTLPLEAIAGDVIEISWNTHNQGSNPAYGVYREIVYLSADSLWSADDPVFGIKDTTGYIPPLSTVSSTMSGPVKDVVEGLYYAVVQTDVRQQIIESDNNNNMSASLDRMEVEVKTLIIDSLMTDSLYLNQELYYKVNVLPGMEGESMIISLQGDSATGFNELYCKFGTVPSRGDFEFGPQQATGAFQHIIIPELQVGTYYIAGYGSMSTGEPQPIELLARIVPFEIHSISPKQGVKDTRDC
ncbi:MAG: right-handed parallel beta-helix repeat-containing protein [Saprospiraceae bacterium]|nr:right-handed parallel beta-helix repeat-containing protein [Candidatus Opimibacter skivensis]